MAVFTPKLQTFFKNCNLGVKNTVLPWFKSGIFWVKSFDLRPIWGPDKSEYN
jgi:hypothetical protein